MISSLKPPLLLDLQHEVIDTTTDFLQAIDPQGDSSKRVLGEIRSRFQTTLTSLEQLRATPLSEEDLETAVTVSENVKFLLDIIHERFPSTP